MPLRKEVSSYQKFMQRAATFLPAKLRPIFLHPAGPTTVFFWAPTCKWGLVLAGIGDLNRSADKISLSQTASLMMTGLVWSRYATVIVPKNWYLFSVNVFVFVTSAYNFVRGLVYQNSKDSPPKT